MAKFSFSKILMSPPPLFEALLPSDPTSQLISKLLNIIILKVSVPKGLLFHMAQSFDFLCYKVFIFKISVFGNYI